MINDIINGLGVTEVLNPEITSFSERSGSSTTSRSGTATDGGQVYTLPDGKQYTLTKAQYDAFNKVYNEAYGYAYSKNINQPQVKDVLKYGQIVADWYKDGKVFTEANYLASQTQTYSVALPNGQVASNLTQAQYDTVQSLLAIYNEAFALSKENGLPVPSWDAYDTMSNAQNALAKLKAQIQAAQDAATPPEVVLPDIMPNVQPSEDKQGGSFPWIAVAIFGAITIGAIALIKSKPKKRR